MPRPDHERDSEVERVFQSALGLDPSARAALLSTTFPNAPEVRREVERLLRAHDAAGDFLATIDLEKSAALFRTVEDEPLPERIGRYRIVRQLGRGAMGIVYLAHDPELDRSVAIKVVRPRRALSTSAERQVVSEARAASALDHPNVVAIHEVGETEDGRPFIAMAHCDGEPLAARIARGPLPVDEAASLAAQIAGALVAAHAVGVVHRDVKPSNVVVSADGRARLMDFGIAGPVGGTSVADGGGTAGVGAHRGVVGTPAYMSPEQGRGAPASPSSDVWSLGIVLHEMLTGHRPSLPERAPGEAGPIWGARPAGVPQRLWGLVRRCTAPMAGARPTAAAVAAELSDHLEQSAVRRRLGRRPFAVVGAVALALALGVGFYPRWAGDRVAAGTATPAALAVLPFLPAVADTALARLGRELVVTLSANLDGAAGLRVVDPLAVLGDRAVRGDAGLEARVVAARALGAASIVHGQIARQGDRVRLDAVVVAADGAPDVQARASTEGRVDDIGALTDSLTVALLRSPWAGAGGRATSAGALTTSSVPALRAYLEGELAIAGARFRLAPEAFARAIAADSTFWFAYWRYWYARSYHGSPVDPAIVSTVLAHRTTFPEPDRLMVESRMEESRRGRIELLQTLTERHPTYWPAWFELGDRLTHEGPFLGHPLEEARVALRRAVELNAEFVPAWEHLLWTSVLERDTLESARALAHLRALRLDTLARHEWDLRPVDYYDYLDHLARTGGDPSPAHADVGAEVLSGLGGAIDPEPSAFTVGNYGFHRAQLDLSWRVVARNPPQRVAEAHRWAAALAWAGRGAWDSASATAHRYARATGHANGALWAFGLAATGAWLGELEPESLVGLRELAARSPLGRSADGAAEIAWLDGIVACARGDVATLAVQRRALASSPAAGAPALAASLGAFEQALAGRTAEAARDLASLELGNADGAWLFTHGARHPFVIGVNRLAASRWLLQVGDTAAAGSLLLLHQTDLPSTLHPLPAANIILGAYGLETLAGVEAGRGRPDLAERYRQLAREQADLTGGRTVASRCPGSPSRGDR